MSNLLLNRSKEFFISNIVLSLQNFHSILFIVFFICWDLPSIFFLPQTYLKWILYSLCLLITLSGLFFSYFYSLLFLWIELPFLIFLHISNTCYDLLDIMDDIWYRPYVLLAFPKDYVCSSRLQITGQSPCTYESFIWHWLHGSIPGLPIGLG